MQKDSSEAKKQSAQIAQDEQALFILTGISDGTANPLATGGSAFPPPPNQPGGPGANTYDNLKREAEQFAAEMKKLQDDINLNGKSVDEQEKARIEQKYADLLAKAKNTALMYWK